MENQEILAMLSRAGARLEGHFRLTSGRHAAVYMQCGIIFQHTAFSEPLCKELASRFSDIDAVVGPAIGAIIMSYEVSRHLGCRNIFTERQNGIMTLRRGFSLEPGERVLVVEDTITTGGTVKEVVSLCLEHGAVVAGVGSIVDRTGGINPFGVPFEALAKMTIPSWTEEECPLCKEGIPCVKPGSRLEE